MPEAAALFPRQINGILDRMRAPLPENGKDNEAKWRLKAVKQLEEMIKTSPVMLAFSHVSVFLSSN